MEPGGLVNATKYGHAASTPQSTAAPPSRSPLTTPLAQVTPMSRPYLTIYGRRPRKRARLMAWASSRCFLVDTAVIRLGTILPRSEIKRCNNLTSLWSILGAFGPENGHDFRRRKNGRRAAAPRADPLPV